MKITSQILEAHLKCNTKCWLRSAGQIGKGNMFAKWYQTQNDSYRQEGIRRLIEGLPQEEYSLSPTSKDLKPASWRLAVGLSLECLYEKKHPSEPNQRISSIMRKTHEEYPPNLKRSGVVLATNLEVVERLPPEDRGRTLQYIPLRFIFRNKLTIEDKLLLGFDAMVLSGALGHKVSYGKIIHGDDCRISRIKTPDLSGKVRKRVESVVTLLPGSSPPGLVLNRNCTECEFRNDCHKMAIEKDELSLLGGMSLKERENYHKKGIFTVMQLFHTFRPRKRPKWLKDKREKYHHSLKALAIREKRIYVVGNPLLKIEGTPVCFDVEALPDREFYYLIANRCANQKQRFQHTTLPMGRQRQ